MDMPASSLDPATAQQLVARYAALVEEHTQAQVFPAPVTSLPAPKAVIKEAVRIVLDALARTHQLTDDLRSFLEEVFVALANYVDDEMAMLAAEHRRASEALEAAAPALRDRIGSPQWEVVSRTSRLAGEIARISADEAAALREEFQSLVAGLDD